MLAVRDAIARYLLDRMRRHPDLATGLALLCEEHGAILTAVQAGDGPTAATLMQAHIEGFVHGWLDR
jgi:DNA-binding GntR family transcriptional regulator